MRQVLPVLILTALVVGPAAVAIHDAGQPKFVLAEGLLADGTHFLFSYDYDAQADPVRNCGRAAVAVGWPTSFATASGASREGPACLAWVGTTLRIEGDGVLLEGLWVPPAAPDCVTRVPIILESPVYLAGTLLLPGRGDADVTAAGTAHSAYPCGW